MDKIVLIIASTLLLGAFSFASGVAASEKINYEQHSEDVADGKIKPAIEDAKNKNFKHGLMDEEIRNNNKVVDSSYGAVWGNEKNH